MLSWITDMDISAISAGITGGWAWQSMSLLWHNKVHTQSLIKKQYLATTEQEYFIGFSQE